METYGKKTFVFYLVTEYLNGIHGNFLRIHMIEIYIHSAVFLSQLNIKKTRVGSLVMREKVVNFVTLE